MKKSTIKSLISFLNGETVYNLPEIKEELETTLARDEARAAANRELYAAMHTVVISHLSGTPVTSSELWADAHNEMPDGASESKMRYGLRALWSNEVIKHDNGRGPATYSRK